MGRVGQYGLKRFPQVFPTASDPMPELQSYRTAIYVSASCWGVLPEEERLSAKEQLEKCRKFLNEQNDLVETILYENEEEAQFDPDSKHVWYALLDAAESRRFDAILVYNLNRVDESCAIACHHLGRFLYPAGIRFISVEDGFDSKIDDMQEYLIRKTRAFTSFQGTIRHRRRFNEGRINRCNVPYGYLYDAEREPHIFVDKETAPYVRDLFEMQLQGMNPVEMARAMNETGAIVPVKRKHELYGTVTVDGGLWKSTVVKTILKNPIYTGDYVVGRTKDRTVNGVVTSSVVDREDWMIMKNHHEPLVSHKDFELAQEIAAGRRFPVIRDLEKTYNPLRIMLRCRHCGNFMSRSLAGTLHCIREDITTYYCDSGRYDSENGCRLFFIEEEKLLSQLKKSFVTEQRMAKQFAARRDALTAFPIFQEWLQEVGKSRADLHEQLKEQIACGKGTDEIYEKLDSITKEENHLMELFSAENPWKNLFCSELDFEDVIKEKGLIRKVLDHISVSKDGTATCHFQYARIKEELTLYHKKLLQAGEEGLWEEETEQ